MADFCSWCFQIKTKSLPGRVHNDGQVLSLSTKMECSELVVYYNPSWNLYYNVVLF